MKDGKQVLLIVDKKGYQTTKKMALATINLAKSKYEKENKHAIVAVEKHNMVTMRRDVFKSSEQLLNEVNGWERGGFKCYYVQAKGK